MASPIIGLLAILSISGIGRFGVRILWRETWPSLPVYLAAVMLAGIGCASLIVQVQAIVGTSATALRATAVILLLTGLAGHLSRRPKLSWVGRISWSKLNVALALVILIAVGCCVAAAIAPSTKIDELNYHMLFGRHVLEDGGLRVYQAPMPLAIVPEAGYQIFESVFHALGAPDAGNLLSLSFAVVLLFFAYGLVAQQTQSLTAGLVAAAVIGIGVYPVVWYVTSGPHALGDLAIVVAVLALLWPERFSGSLWPRGTVLLASMASAIGASTKISLVPISLLITIYACIRYAGSTRDLRITAAIAAGMWGLILGPLVSWSWIHTGAPFGAAFANFFGHTIYEPAVFAEMESSRKINQAGLISAIVGALRAYNVPQLVLFCGGLMFCFYRRGPLLLLGCLVLIQLALIAMLLPHDMRFLGGLQYVAAMVAVVGLASLRSSISWERKCVWILAGLVPWLGLEVYYVRPFFAVDTGLISRSDFLLRYVAFTDDFRALDSLLPAKCELYVQGSRGPSVYFPRRIIYSLSDYRRDLPLYEFSVSTEPAELSDRGQSGILCGPEIYRNPGAIIEAYRTPGARPLSGIVSVKSCSFMASSGPDRLNSNGPARMHILLHDK